MAGLASTRREAEIDDESMEKENDVYSVIGVGRCVTEVYGCCGSI